VIPSDNLAFHLTARQRRAHRVVGAAMASTAPVGVGGGVVSLVQGFPIGAGWILVGLVDLAYALMFLNYARAVTECTPAGLRARTTRGKVREWPWPQVAAITVDAKRNSPRWGGAIIKHVVVTSTGGDRVRLVTPMCSVGPDEEEFTASVRQIQDYWTAAIEAARTWGSE